MSDDPIGRIAADLTQHLSSHELLTGYEGEIHVSYVSNVGGFVNHSFAITTPHHALHVKLAAPADQPKLRQWATHAERLQQRYHAPEVLDWIELPGHQLGGLVFPSYAGSIPGAWHGWPVDDLATVLNHLHADDELLHALGSRTQTCADVYLNTFDERFQEDLIEIGQKRPAFLSARACSELQAEADHLRDLVRRHDAFGEPANSVTHADVWLDNVLVTQRGWFLLDWDEMMVGDPALDAAMFGGPDIRTGRWDVHPVFANRNTAFLERLALYQRASLLDQCIDVLADHVEADRWLTDARPYRAAKETVHHTAMAAYTNLYGFGRT